MAGWDDEDFTPQLAIKANWDDEEEDAGVAKGWDDEEEGDEKEEEKPKEEPKPQPKGEGTNRPKNKAKERKKLLEKKDEEDKKVQEQEEARLAKLTPSERQKEKQRRQKLVEEADREVMLDAFQGVSQGEALAQLKDPANEAEALKFAATVAARVVQAKTAKKEAVYLELVKELVGLCAAEMDADDVKQLSAKINSLHNDKLKASKKPKKKSKQKGPSATSGKKDLNDYAEFGTSAAVEYDDMDDFM